MLLAGSRWGRELKIVADAEHQVFLGHHIRFKPINTSITVGGIPYPVAPLAPHAIF